MQPAVNYQKRTEPAGTLAYVLPFALFIGFLGLRSLLPLPPQIEYPLRLVVVSAAIVFFWGKSGIWRPRFALASVLVGLGVFIIWILPDLLWPGYRSHWIFQNIVTGKAASSIPLAVYDDWLFLSIRVLGSALVVPIIEELFWRGWLMRYAIDANFRKVPLGTFRPLSFVITAVLFASEHGPFWEVGLLAGLAYNYWIVRTKSLADCMVAHAVTNACLAAYVIGFHQWQYWL
jgi:CAAX prenyl protease-like protein